MSSRKKTSVVWTMLDDSNFSQLVSDSKNMRQVTDVLNISSKGGNYKTIKQRIIHLNLDTSHWGNANKSKTFFRKLTKDSFIKEWLIPDKVRSGSALKRHLLRFGLIEEKCVGCGCGPTWENISLILQLDHIDGDSSNNRISNLRLLCPNCHSQTPTFAGRGNLKPKKKHYCKCGSEILKQSKSCNKCKSRNFRPDKHTLLQELKESNFLQLSKKYGVSDNAIRKWCVAYNIPTKKKEYMDFWFDTCDKIK